AAQTRRRMEDRLPASRQPSDAGLDRYRAGNYSGAHAAFTRVTDEYAYNARTTAAHLMAGKAAYAEGDFERAISTLTTFLRLYPESRYATEAERVRRLAIQGGPPAPAAAPPFDLGVVLPASGDTDYLAQALFNGIRLAVDEHNAARADRPVRLVFRDTGGEAEGAVEAVRLVVDAGADAIV